MPLQRLLRLGRQSGCCLLAEKGCFFDAALSALKTESEREISDRCYMWSCRSASSRAVLWQLETDGMLQNGQVLSFCSEARIVSEDGLT